MHSRTDVRLAIVTFLALAFVSPLAATTAQPSEQGPTRAQIAQALEVVKADPNLATEQTIKTLEWKKSTGKPAGTPAWLLWIGGLFRWIEQSARLLIWGSAIVLAGMLVGYLVRVTRGLRAGESAVAPAAPTHVRDLDIRPETLPSDIGGSARAMWDRGEHRAALALLYRGMLSRLAHVHRLPVRDSSTEGDCLNLAAAHLSGLPRDYASRLVRVWQRAVYGREDVQADAVYGLCDEFAPALDARRPREAGAGGGAA